jgi:hypothetical protein
MKGRAYRIVVVVKTTTENPFFWKEKEKKKKINTGHFLQIKNRLTHCQSQHCKKSIACHRSVWSSYDPGLV